MSTTTAAAQQQKQQQRPDASSPLPGLPALHCEHGDGTDTQVLLAVPQLSALPQLEPLSFEVGGPPPLPATAQETRRERQQQH